MEAGKGRTIIAVAHVSEYMRWMMMTWWLMWEQRLSTIQHTDVIYVLKDGMDGEYGTHGGLLEKKRLHFHMVGLFFWRSQI
jgi:ABC-type multidrug transport system fused ATPase/permease subunit